MSNKPGFLYSVAIDQDRRLWAWGRIRIRQLGWGHYERRLAPTQVPNIEAVEAVAAGSVGTDLSLAVTPDGKFYSWGGRNSTPTLVRKADGEEF